MDERDTGVHPNWCLWLGLQEARDEREPEVGKDNGGAEHKPEDCGLGHRQGTAQWYPEEKQPGS